MCSFVCPYFSYSAGEGTSNGEVTRSTCESNVVNEKCKDCKLTKDILIVILILLLLLLIGFTIFFVVVLLRKVSKCMCSKWIARKLYVNTNGGSLGESLTFKELSQLASIVFQHFDTPCSDGCFKLTIIIIMIIM